MAKSVDKAAEKGLTNHVTVFSNGMGHFQRVFHVAQGDPTRISIPFKNEHIADALESLNVFGSVQYSVPPSYTPTNSDDTSLEINPANVTASLLQALSGAKFSYRLPGESDWTSSTLVGLETVQGKIDGLVVPFLYVSVLKEGGEIVRHDLDAIASYRFDDPAVQSEIDKAIKKNFQQIKPDSTFLDLALTPIGETDQDVTVAYKVPLAAWKLRYNVYQDDNGINLEGSAIVDNCTDEDWVDTYVSVVTGDPISFYSPDLALVNHPVRQTVHIVESVAQGYVAAEEGTTLGGAGRSKGVRAAAAAPMAAMRSMSFSNRASFGLEAAGCSPEAMYDAPMAESPGVEVQEVGDFCVFTSKEPVTITAKQSAVVPMFNLPLPSSGEVLLYKESSHPRRPFRALKFKNTAGHDLGKGKVGVYKKGIFQGEAVLETTKPGENRTLPFCRENGVRIVRENTNTDNTVTSLSFAKGFGYEERRYRGTTVYVVTNKKSEAFKLLLEHNSVLSQATTPPVVTGCEVKEMEKISDGYRIYLDLGANQELRIEVVETYVHQSKVAIGNNYNWIVSNVISPKHPLAKDPHIQTCLKLHKELEQVRKDISKQQGLIDSLDNDANRLRANIASCKDGGDTEERRRWLTDLAGKTNQIDQIKNTTLPKLEDQAKELDEKLADALATLSAQWSA